MTKSGYYCFLELDVTGYTVLKIYSNDSNLISDVKKNYEAAGVDYKCAFCKDDKALIQRCLKTIYKYGVACRDMTGLFLEPGYHPVDDALERFEYMNIWKE